MIWWKAAGLGGIAASDQRPGKVAARRHGSPTLMYFGLCVWFGVRDARGPRHTAREPGVSSSVVSSHGDSGECLSE